MNEIKNILTCAICASKNVRVYIEIKNFPYYLCEDCQGISLPQSLLTNQAKRHSSREYKLSRMLVESKDLFQSDSLEQHRHDSYHKLNQEHHFSPKFFQ